MGERSRLIRSKQKTLKWNKKSKKSKKRKKEIVKLVKMIIKAIIIMISWHYNTMKMRNNTKLETMEKLKKHNKGTKKSVNWK